MNAKDAAALIGKTVTLLSDGLRFYVEILDVREAYGRTDYKVKPVGGSGEKWVSRDRVTHEK